MDARVAGRYARALFAAAKKEKIVSDVDENLRGICAILAAEPRLKTMLENPEVARADKLALLEKLFSDRVTALTMSALRLLLEKRREHVIERVADIFSELRRDDENVLRVELVSAQPLTDEQEKALITKLRNATGKQIDATTVVDPDLIGGVKIHYGDFVLDGTVKGSLQRMKEKLLHDLLVQA